MVQNFRHYRADFADEADKLRVGHSLVKQRGVARTDIASTSWKRAERKIGDPAGPSLLDG